MARGKIAGGPNVILVPRACVRLRDATRGSAHQGGIFIDPR
jgi:hypothetical protein